MNIQKRKEISKRLEKWTPLIMSGGILIGALLGSLLYYFTQGEFPYEVLTAGLIVSIAFPVIDLIKQKRKKDNIPEADERVIHNVFRFFAYSSHIFLGIIMIFVAVLTLLGRESISIYYLWAFFFLYLWIVGIGAMIVRRR